LYKDDPVTLGKFTDCDEGVTVTVNILPVFRRNLLHPPSV